MAVITKIVGQSRVDMVVEALTKAILSREYALGEYLPVENDLCEQLSVSRSVLREAMRVMVYRGLLEIRQGRGTVVSAPKDSVPEEALSIFVESTGVTFNQLMEFRAPLEIEVARLAALRRDAHDIQVLEGFCDKLQEPNLPLEDYIEADIAFHQALIDATKNPVFGITVRPIVRFLRRSRELTIEHRGVAQVIDHHGGILAAVRDGDAKLASDRMAAHMAAAWEDLKSLYEEGIFAAVLSK